MEGGSIIMSGRKASWREINEKYVYPARELINSERFTEAKDLLEKGFKEFSDPHIAMDLGDLYGNEFGEFEVAKKYYIFAFENYPLIDYKILALTSLLGIPEMKESELNDLEKKIAADEDLRNDDDILEILDDLQLIIGINESKIYENQKLVYKNGEKIGLKEFPEDFYRSKLWMDFRIEFLRENRFCHYCEKPASTVHHIASPKVYPERCLDPLNCVPTCKKCHRIYHQE